MMEREIGSCFNDGEFFLAVIERPPYDPEKDIGFINTGGKDIPITATTYNACTKCFYFRKSYCKTLPIRGECSNRNRNDEKKVIFIQLNDPIRENNTEN